MCRRDFSSFPPKGSGREYSLNSLLLHDSVKMKNQFTLSKNIFVAIFISISTMATFVIRYLMTKACYLIHNKFYFLIIF